jgi:hypothetical protein
VPKSVATVATGKGARHVWENRRFPPGNVRNRSMPDYRFRFAGCAGRKNFFDFAESGGRSEVAETGVIFLRYYVAIGCRLSARSDG